MMWKSARQFLSDRYSPENPKRIGSRLFLADLNSPQPQARLVASKGEFSIPTIGMHPTRDKDESIPATRTMGSKG